MKPFERLYKYFYKKADIIHVLSPNIIESDEILSLNRQKCIVIPYGVNTANNENKNILINTYDINKFANGKKKLLCVGRFVNWKGFFIIIEIMKYIDDAVLLIAGNGEEFENYKKYINDNGLQNKILLLGNVINNKEKDYLFSNIDIFILPSIRKSESFGIVQLEAMKHSKPVINTNLGTGVNYVSIDKETGLTVEPKNPEQLKNAINKLLKDDNLRLTLGENAQKRVNEVFNINTIKEKYNSLMKDFFS